DAPHARIHAHESYLYRTGATEERASSWRAGSDHRSRPLAESTRHPQSDRTRPLAPEAGASERAVARAAVLRRLLYPYGSNLHEAQPDSRPLLHMRIGPEAWVENMREPYDFRGCHRAGRSRKAAVRTK